jgi:Family of unknown function (DUF6585)
MDEPIYYRDVAYPSLEAMPPAVRAEYEAEDDEPDEADNDEQNDDDEQDEGAGDEGDDSDDDDDSDGVTQPPAWGGARANVTPPPEFAQVSLGPIIHVAEHHGLQLPSFGPPHVTLLAIYRDGLAYRTSGQQVHSLPWEQLATITSDLTYFPANASSEGHTEHKYTLTTANGDVFILDDRLQNVGDEAAAIKQALFALLRPPALARYQAGQALAFGPLTAQKQTGLQLDGKHYPWDAIQEIVLHNGHLRVKLGGGKKHDTRVSVIPNVELLCQIIGVKFDSSDLAHWYGTLYDPP